MKVRHMMLEVMTCEPIESGLMKLETTPGGGDNAGNPVNPDPEEGEVLRSINWMLQGLKDSCAQTTAMEIERWIFYLRRRLLEIETKAKQFGRATRHLWQSLFKKTRRANMGNQ